MKGCAAKRGCYWNINISHDDLVSQPSTSGHWAGNSSPCDQRPGSPLPSPLLASPIIAQSNQAWVKPPLGAVTYYPWVLQNFLIPPHWQSVTMLTLGPSKATSSSHGQPPCSSWTQAWTFFSVLPCLETFECTSCDPLVFSDLNSFELHTWSTLSRPWQNL